VAILVSSLQRSLSRLELTVAAIIIFIIAAIFMRQVLVMAARAEKKFLEVSVININTALHHQAALLYLNGQKAKLLEMDGMNPFKLMQSAADVSIEGNEGETMDVYTGIQYRILPSRYRGEVDDQDPDTIEAGYWYFDRSQGLLLYRVSNDEFFNSDNSKMALIRFRVVLNYEDSNTNNRYDPGTDIYQGVKLEDMGGFQWRI
jgi:hypothetical protein